jgi:hypothetical protein
MKTPASIARMPAYSLDASPRSSLKARRSMPRNLGGRRPRHERPRTQLRPGRGTQIRLGPA